MLVRHTRSVQICVFFFCCHTNFSFLLNIARPQITLVCVFVCYLAAVLPNTYLSRWQRQLMLVVPFLFFPSIIAILLLQKCSLCHVTCVCVCARARVCVCMCECVWWGTRSWNGFYLVHFSLCSAWILHHFQKRQWILNCVTGNKLGTIHQDALRRTIT